MAELEKSKAELEAKLNDLPEAAVPSEAQAFSIAFDKEFYGVDAAGSVTLHYTLQRPASLKTINAGTWNVSIEASSETETSNSNKHKQQLN